MLNTSVAVFSLKLTNDMSFVIFEAIVDFDSSYIKQSKQKYLCYWLQCINIINGIHNSHCSFKSQLGSKLREMEQRINFDSFLEKDLT